MMEHPLYDGQAGAVRVCVFLIVALATAVPALGWVLGSLCVQRKIARQLLAFVIFLLLSDVSELTMTLSIVRGLMGGGVFCGKTSAVSLECPLMLLGCRVCGLYFHQLVAVEGTLLLKFPHTTALLFSRVCSVGMAITCTLVVALFIMFTSNLPNLVFMMLSMLFSSGCVLVCLLDISTSKQQTVRQQGLMMMSVCLFTVAILYGPLVVYMALHQRPEAATLMERYKNMTASPWGTVALSVSSLRVTADALLCVLVCRAIPYSANNVCTKSSIVEFGS